MLRISSQAMTLIENLKEIDLEELEKWFLEKSNQTIVGSGTITDFLIYKKQQ